MQVLAHIMQEASLSSFKRIRSMAAINKNQIEYVCIRNGVSTEFDLASSYT